jgi:hypothetical protein
VPSQRNGAEQFRLKLAELSAALDAAHRVRQEAESSEQRTAQDRDGPAQLAIEPARVMPNASGTTQRPRPLVAWTTLVAALMMTVGVGLVLVGRSLEPPLASLREIELDLGETPIQTVETDDPLPDFVALERQKLLHRAAIIVGWCLLIVFSSQALLARV